MVSEARKAVVEKAEKEVAANYEYFKSQLDELEKEHSGEFALLRRREVVEFFPSSRAAFNAGMKRFGEGEFSVQEVTRRIINRRHKGWRIPYRQQEGVSTIKCMLSVGDKLYPLDSLDFNCGLSMKIVDKDEQK